jgi:hypothetical protein
VWIGVRKTFQNLLKRGIYPKSAKIKNSYFNKLSKMRRLGNPKVLIPNP